MENTYDLEDLLVNSSVNHLRNDTQFNIKTIHSILLGRCYMFTL